MKTAIKIAIISILFIVLAYSSNQINKAIFYSNDITDSTSYIMKRNIENYRDYLTNKNWATIPLSADQSTLYVETNDYSIIPFSIASGTGFSNNDANEALVPPSDSKQPEYIDINNVKYKVVGQIDYALNLSQSDFTVVKGTAPDLEEIEYIVFNGPTKVDDNFESISNVAPENIVSKSYRSLLMIAIFIVLIIVVYYKVPFGRKG